MFRFVKVAPTRVYQIPKPQQVPSRPRPPRPHGHPVAGFVLRLYSSGEGGLKPCAQAHPNGAAGRPNATWSSRAPPRIPRPAPRAFCWCTFDQRASAVKHAARIINEKHARAGGGGGQLLYHRPFSSRNVPPPLEKENTLRPAPARGTRLPRAL